MKINMQALTMEMGAVLNLILMDNENALTNLPQLHTLLSELKSHSESGKPRVVIEFQPDIRYILQYLEDAKSRSECNQLSDYLSGNIRDILEKACEMKEEGVDISAFERLLADMTYGNEMLLEVQLNNFLEERMGHNLDRHLVNVINEQAALMENEKKYGGKKDV